MFDQKSGLLQLPRAASFIDTKGRMSAFREYLFLPKFGNYKKITVFWTDFQRIEIKTLRWTKIVNPSFCSEINKKTAFY